MIGDKIWQRISTGGSKVVRQSFKILKPTRQFLVSDRLKIKGIGTISECIVEFWLWLGDELEGAEEEGDYNLEWSSEEVESEDSGKAPIGESRTETLILSKSS